MVFADSSASSHSLIFLTAEKFSIFYCHVGGGRKKKYFSLFIANCVCSKILSPPISFHVPFSTRRLLLEEVGILLTSPHLLLSFPSKTLSQIKIQSFGKAFSVVAEWKILKSKGKQHSSSVLVLKPSFFWMISPSGAAPFVRKSNHFMQI